MADKMVWLRSPSSLDGKTFRDFTAESASQKEALSAAKQWLTREEQGKGLLFSGPPGIGKTLLATIVLHAAQLPQSGFVSAFDYEKWLRNRMQYSDMARLASSVEDKPRAEDLLRRWDMMDERLRLMRVLPLLVLDDIGKEHLTASNWMPSEWHRLLRGRYMAGKPTILTTNVQVTQWGTVYGAAMASFLWEAYTVVPFDGPDVRVPEKARALIG